MSAGVFTRSTYAASYSTSPVPLHPILVQPETLTAQIAAVINAAPTTGTDNPISAVISRNKRQRGLIPRTVTLQAPATGQPSGYKPLGYTVIPALTPAFYNAAIKGVTCDYLGAEFTVVSRSPELAQ